jgi:hypothetical protein
MLVLFCFSVDTTHRPGWYRTATPLASNSLTRWMPRQRWTCDFLQSSAHAHRAHQCADMHGPVATHDHWLSQHHHNNAQAFQNPYTQHGDNSSTQRQHQPKDPRMAKQKLLLFALHLSKTKSTCYQRTAHQPTNHHKDQNQNKRTVDIIPKP